ncbi:MAG: ribosome recycling factor [Caldiserica bacterium]|nr:ribosome recycling factor [Caldisericota bacterium]
MEHELLVECRKRMDKTIAALEADLAKVQTGRANPALLEDIKVDYYGTPTPLKHIAHITAPDPDLLVVRPFDRSQIGAMEKAIVAADLGLNPQSDGNVIRIKVPRLSEERREELVRLVKRRGEEAKVALRNIRREYKEKLDDMKDEGALPEDDHRRLREQLDKITQEYSEKVDGIVEAKAQQMRTL